MILVIIYGGKRNDVDWVKYQLFPNQEIANEFIESFNNDSENKGKYWSYADFLSENERLELCRPDYYYND